MKEGWGRSRREGTDRGFLPRVTMLFMTFDFITTKMGDRVPAVTVRLFPSSTEAKGTFFSLTDSSSLSFVTCLYFQGHWTFSFNVFKNTELESENREERVRNLSFLDYLLARVAGERDLQG